MKKFLVILTILCVAIGAYAAELGPFSVKNNPPAADSAAATAIKYFQLIKDGKFDEAKTMETASIQRIRDNAKARAKEQARTQRAQTEKVFEYTTCDDASTRENADIRVIIHSETVDGDSLDFRQYLKKIDGKWYICDGQGK